MSTDNDTFHFKRLDGTKTSARDEASSRSSARTIFARNIRIERARQKISQGELASRCGLSRIHVGSIERCDVACSIDVIERIAKAFELGIPRLFIEEKSRSDRFDFQN